MAAVLLTPLKSWLRVIIAAATVGAVCSLAVAAPQDAQPRPASKRPHLKAIHPGKAANTKDKPASKSEAKQEPGQKNPGAADPHDPAPPESPPPPYEPEVLRLAEILGALAYLDDLCGSKADWRAKMQNFLEAEAKTEDRKERLAGTFNRSFHDYEQSYQACTPNAQIIISRFLSEGGRLAHEVVNRFSAS
ncbi:conserved exported hypothetical protein [Methylocella tundrae]|uniref:TIGR02301 family protein n=1 Tax=Methylocella tundrae TaxID=227605 RepID=A0A8B6M908_METTU|nr:TIGR02301 family protein [Methylocella tundrae]VTZ23785.1 conserved exported hypothetical protein [Methylocella tundrae]VTZ50951.1 conserved exported hypothetical protein [Methylocella tundrae]